MKNYIANERGDWATSSAYIRYSLSRSIHFGRMYTSDRKDKDLCEALRCLGQGLHTLEDFGAHTNYCELALREMGFLNVFPHTGTQTQIHLHGHYVFPLVTGTFGMVDFLHSVLGEATDHFTQSEVNEMDIALGNAESSTSSSGSLNALTGLLGKIPGTRDLVSEAEELKARSEAQEYTNRSRGIHSGYAVGESRAGPPQLPDIDPAQTVAKIYPILQFRDKVVRKLTSVIEKIPGLEAVIEKISDTLTVFIMSLLAPFVRPIINAASKSLQSGSSGVIHASGQHQYEPWTDPICTDPTHSLLSKDHFSNILNEPAGHVASAILRYVAPRVLYAWEHPTVHEEEVIQDCLSVFHHPALRNMNNEAHRNMFEAVQSWVNARNDRGANLNVILSAEGVRAGKNNTGDPDHPHGGGGGGHSHGQFPAFNSSHSPPQQQQQQQQQQGSTGPSIPWAKISKLPIPGVQNLQKLENTISSFIPGGVARDVDSASGTGIEAQLRSQSQSQQHYQSESYYTPGGSAGDYYSQQGGGGEYTYPSHSQAQAQAQTHPQMQSYPHPYPHPNVHAGNYPPAQQWQGYQYPYPHPHPLLQDTGRDADIERIP